MELLSFEDKPMPLIEYNGRLWLKSSDIACALGYSRDDKISRLYSRHSQEFSASMTVIHRNPTLGQGNPPTECRLFSLRGAHLLAMFSRTAKGMEFRRWALDQLEKIENEKPEDQSILADIYQAAAIYDNAAKRASTYGKGLSDYKKIKPPLLNHLMELIDKSQMKLPLFA